MELTYKWIALANRHYLMYLNKRLASYGLSGSQYLFILNICRQPGLTQDKLPDIIHINKSNVTRALAHLEKHGFIRREVNPQDKRHGRRLPDAEDPGRVPARAGDHPGLGRLGDQPADGGREAHPAGPAQARGGLGPRVPQHRGLGPGPPARSLGDSCRCPCRAGTVWSRAGKVFRLRAMHRAVPTHVSPAASLQPAHATGTSPVPCGEI